MILESLVTEGVYAGDNFFVMGRNLSFLEDTAFIQAFSRNAKTEVERAVLWRTAVILWGVRNALHLEGDLVECACYKGTTAKIICDTVNFDQYSQKKYYLYDLFEHNDTTPHSELTEHGEDLADKVREKFKHYDNVIVTQGRVPDVLADVAPDKIAFMHLDLNHAQAELGALECLFERMTPGAILILDDYGWLDYREQKLIEDPWFQQHGYHVLELPTGQGMVIKH